MYSEKKNSYFWLIVAASFFGSMGLAAIEIGHQLRNLGIFFSWKTFWWPTVILMSAISIAGMVLVWFPKTKTLLDRIFKCHRLWGKINFYLLAGIFFILSAGFSAWVIFWGYMVLDGYYVRIFLYYVVSILGMLLIKPMIPGRNWKVALAGSLIFTISIYQMMIFIPSISNSPFSLSWSEGSRYYYGSLLFSRSLYQVKLPLSPLHPSRYILLSVPFIIRGLPIWVHRLWQVSLWIGLALWAGYLFARRLKIKDPFILILYTAWAFVFLHLGPVYYHLLLCVILIYWGVDFGKPVRTYLILFIASVWAGLSRVNWIPVPFLLVLTLYLLETPWVGTVDRWKYLRPLIGWLSGIPIALFTYLGYIQVSGNAAKKFGSSFTSELLWNRLFPNSTFSLGILLASLLVSLPLIMAIIIQIRKGSYYIQPVKWVGFILISLVLFLGGLVVSVKIGGGSNLHNLDAYFVVLITIAGYIFWGKMVQDRQLSDRIERTTPGLLVTVLGIIVPVLFVLRIGGPVMLPDPQKDKADLQQLRQIISNNANPGQEILFISERQLLVFKQIPDISLVPDYEKVELMEMTMAGNTEYLERFSNDISRQRFAVIITDPIQKGMKDEIEPFSEEHNVWVRNVVIPLLKYYRYSYLGERTGIVIMTPK